MKKNLPLILMIACACVFVAGVLELFKLRFETGDVYPAYSSLRADPLGTMAFYESLEKVPGLTVQRDYSAGNKLPEEPNTAYLHLASSTREWRWMPEDLCKEIRQFLARGGRLVITMEPQATNNRRFLEHLDEDYDPDHKKSDDKKPDAKKVDSKNKSVTNSPPDKPATNALAMKAATNSLPNRMATNSTPIKTATNTASVKASTNSVPDKPEKKTDSKRPTRKRPFSNDEDERDLKLTSLEEFWGVEFEVINLPQGLNESYGAVRVINQTDLPLPYALDWHSGIVCSNLNAAWQKIYTRGTNATVIERRFGHGSVVIATDSYFLSNEAMQKDRHADLLVWLVGPDRNVVFDEAHLGVVESSGVAMLMRKYRLHWLAIGLVVLAGLFIWKNSVSLVPPHADEGLEEFIAGKDAAAGFVNLLRRSIPGRELLTTCFAEWTKSAAPTGKYSAARLQQAEAIYQSEKSAGFRDRNPVGAYREICSVLKSSKFQVPSSKLMQDAPSADRKENR
jgi:hypothetical protein